MHKGRVSPLKTLDTTIINDPSTTIPSPSATTSSSTTTTATATHSNIKPRPITGMSNRPNSAVSTFGINPSISSQQSQDNLNSNTAAMQGQHATTISVPPMVPKSNNNEPVTPKYKSIEDDTDTVDFSNDGDVPIFSVQDSGAGRRHSGGGDAKEGMMELTNLVANPMGEDGDLPPISIGMKKDESSEQLNLSLHQCARDGDEYNMKILINNITSHLKKKINAFDDEDLSPLHYAARYNHLSVVRLLVEAGANCQIRGEDDVTPLHHAARYRRERAKKNETPTDEDEPKPHFKKLLIESAEDDEEKEENLEDNEDYRNKHDRLGDAGEDEEEGEEVEGNEKIIQDNIKTRISGASASRDIKLGANGLPTGVDGYGGDVDKEGSIITYMVAKGANPNCVDIYGQTALHFAAMRGNEIACRDLLSCPDIKFGYPDNQGITPLHAAAIHNQMEIARMLLDAGADLMCRDKELSTPLHLAATEGNIDLVNLLFEFGARTKEAWVTLSEMVTATDIELSTCLHHAVDNGHYKVAELLLEKRAEVNKPRKHFMYPIHLAAQCGNKEIVRLLVENHARIDAANDDQATALHRAASLNHVEVAKFLVDRGARINRRDKDNYTPLLLASSYGNTAMVELLIQKGADYTCVDKSDKTPVYLAAEENNAETLAKLLSYPQVKRLINDGDGYDNCALHIAAQEGYLGIVRLLLNEGAILDNKNEEEQTALHLAAKYGRTNIVKELIKQDKSIVNDEDDGSNTALHLAAMNGHNKVTKALLELGADVSARNYNQWTPLDLAASKGWVKTCSVLLEEDAPVDPTDKNKTTPLHLASSSGHAGVVELLLEWDADVTLGDDEGKNCLDRAIENAHADVALVIVNSSVWKDALRNATKDPVTGYVDTPMRKLIKKMPDVAERVFDRCLSYGAEKNPERMEYEITFDYEFLDDLYAKWIQVGIQRLEHPESDYGSTTGSQFSGDDDYRLDPDATPYSADTNVLKKNHPMSIMVSSEREDLLAHPLVTSLLTHKWNTFGRFFYYLSFFIYVIFLTFLTGYMVVSHPPHDYGNDSSKIEDNECSNLSQNRDQLLFCRIGTYVIIALAAFNVLKELLQIYQAKLNYLDWTNLIEWTVYITAFLLVISFNECQRETGYRYEWQWNLGVVAVFLAWVDLVLIIQKVPRFGIYVVMFTDVLFTFAQFFIVFFLFIVGFALAFYCLFQNKPAFNSVGKSLIKTSVMMIGEFEFDDIFNSPDSPVKYPPAAYLIWVLFMVIMSILIMNLLVGLAVDDIKAVQEQAVLKRLAMQVDLVLNVERVIPSIIRRKEYTRRKTIKPNVYANNPILRFIKSSSSISSEALQKALNPELDEIEKVQESQDKLKGDVKKMKRTLKNIREQNQKLESMMKAMLTSQNVKWEEEDFQEEEEEEILEAGDERW